MDIKKLNRNELKDLLAGLKLYADMSKKLGNRGRTLFKKDLLGETSLVVEYFPSIDESVAYKTSLDVYSKVFSLSPKQEDIVFVQRDNLEGGMKVYKDDSMVDISFSKFENILKR